MHPILKTVLGVIAGIVVAICVIMLAESIAEYFFPAEIAYPTPEEREKMISTAPLMAKLLFLAGYALSSFFGAYMAARMASDKWKIISGLTVGFFLLLGGLVIFIAYNYPLWMTMGSCLCFLLFAWLGAWIAKK